MLPVLRQRDCGDECDRCDHDTARCVVCGQRAYFVRPAALCSIGCLFAFRAHFHLATSRPEVQR